MLRTLCKLTYTFKIKKNLSIQLLAKCSTVTRSNIRNNLVQFSKYEVKILQLVNTSKLNKLKEFISASYAETLISKRASSGPYKSLNDILLKTEIDVDIWNNFCNSFISHHIKQKWKKYIKPVVNTTVMPETILGIYVGPTAITWTIIDHYSNVLGWDSIIWKNDSLTCNIINLVSSFVQQLPLSSSYVIETLKISNKSHHTSLMQYQINISIGSCIKLIINQRTNNSNSSEDVLYVFKSLTTARFFNQLLGSEVIAADYIMEKILDDTKTKDGLLQNVSIADELKKKYMEREPSEREQMGWSLLTTLACFHIIRSCIS